MMIKQAATLLHRAGRASHSGVMKEREPSVRGFIATILLMILSPIASAQDAGLPDRLRAYFQPHVETRDFSGIIAVRRGDALIAYERFGFADWEVQREFAPEDRFSAGALTQLMTAGLIVELEAEGILNRSNPVRDYIRELHPDYTFSIGDLLEQRSGFSGPIPDSSLRDARHDTFIAWLNEVRDVEGTGGGANTNEVDDRLLAIVAERAAGGRFETLAMFRQLDPLGMTDSRFSRSIPSAAVPGYQPGPLPLDLRRPEAMMVQMGADGLFTSIDDLLILGRAIATRQIDLFQPDGSRLGGLELRQVDGRAVYWATSAHNGYATGLVLVPEEDLVVAYAANIESSPAVFLPHALPELVLGLEPFVMEPRPASRTLLPVHRDAIGRYDGDQILIRPVEIAELGAELVLRSPEGREDYLTPIGEDRLFWRAMNTELVYQRDAAGRVAALTATTAQFDGADPVTVELPRTDLPPPEPAAPLED